MNTYGVKYFTLSHGLASPRLGLLMCPPADKNVDSAQWGGGSRGISCKTICAHAWHTGDKTLLKTLSQKVPISTSSFLEPRFLAGAATGGLAELPGTQTPVPLPALNSTQRLQAQQPCPAVKQSQELFHSMVPTCKLSSTQKRAGEGVSSHPHKVPLDLKCPPQRDQSGLAGSG